MTSLHSFAITCLRLLSVYAFLQALPMLQQVLSFVLFARFSPEGVQAMDRANFAVAITPMLLLLGGGVILWGRAPRLADWMLGGHGNGLPQIERMSTRDILSLAFSVVGVFVFLQALPLLVSLGMNLQMLAAYARQPLSQQAIQAFWPQVGSLTVQLLFSALLFFQSRTLANFWHGLQHDFGYKTEAELADSNGKEPR